MNNTKLIKETDNFSLVQLLGDPMEIAKNDNLYNYYILYKGTGTVETCNDSLVMAMYALHQAENGFTEVKDLFNPKEKVDKEEIVKH